MKKSILLLSIASALALVGCGETPDSTPKQEEQQQQQEEKHVEDATLTGIIVSTNPSKTVYYEGESFDPAGMVVKATYSDGTSETITNYQLPNQALVLTVDHVSIAYNGFTADVVITVKAYIEVTFYDENSDLIETKKYKENETPSCDYEKEDTDAIDYTLGWALTPGGEALNALPAVTENISFYAVVSQKTRQYTVTYYWGEKVLKTEQLDYGTTPSFVYDVQDTDEFDYTFRGWSLSKAAMAAEEVPAVRGDMNLYAVIIFSRQKYPITFYDEDGNFITTNDCYYGFPAFCDYEPTDTAEWDKTLDGWSLTPGGEVLSELPDVLGSTSYYAVVSKVKQKYNITFKVDENTYATKKVEYGVSPVVQNPTKAATAEYTYTFDGWSLTNGGAALSSLPTVTGEATYYAVFKATKNKYTITLKLNNDESDVVLNDEYGTTYFDFEDYEPTKEGYKFTHWYTDVDLTNEVQFPVTLTGNTTYYAGYREKIDVVGCLKELLTFGSFDPYSYIPETMRPTYTENAIVEGDLPSYETDVNVSDINTTGFGEQWKMILDNIKESERFFTVLTMGDNSFTNAIGMAIGYFTEFEDETIDSADNGTISYVTEYSKGTFTMDLTFLEEISTPFGSFKPSINLTCSPLSGEKTIQIYINENNSMKCLISDSMYVFGIKYGATIAGKTVLRSAYCELTRPVEDDDTYVEGHIGEFITYTNEEEQKELTSSYADFYITERKAFAIGNKASGLLGFEGTILESYDVETGSLLGYLVSEKKDMKFAGLDLGEIEYHTFWLNLETINGISTVKTNKKSGVVAPNENPHEVYINGSAKVFEPEYNKKTVFKTSREYDIEMRTHYYFDEEGNLIETETPMMFIQDNDDYYNNGYHNTDFNDFNDNIVNVSKISGGGLSTTGKSIAEELRFYWLGSEGIMPSLKDEFDNHKTQIAPDTIEEWLK